MNCIHCFQRVRFVMRDRPSTIRDQLDAFRQALSNVTDSIVNVDALELHAQVIYMYWQKALN